MQLIKGYERLKRSFAAYVGARGITGQIIGGIDFDLDNLHLIDATLAYSKTAFNEKRIVFSFMLLGFGINGHVLL